MVLTSYEIQLYQGGTWKINAIFDDDALAVFEARRMFESGRYGGIRVVAEEFNQDTGATKTRTIFRDSTVDKHNVAAKRVRAGVIKDSAVDRRKRETGKAVRRKKAKQKKIEPLKLLLVLSLLVSLALAGLLGLQHLQAMF